MQLQKRAFLCGNFSLIQEVKGLNKSCAKFEGKNELGDPLYKAFTIDREDPYYFGRQASAHLVRLRLELALFKKDKKRSSLTSRNMLFFLSKPWSYTPLG